MQENKYEFAGKTVLVMGLGRFGGGVDVARSGHSAGAKVIVTDLASAEQLSNSLSRLRELDGIEFHLGSHAPADFEQGTRGLFFPFLAFDGLEFSTAFWAFSIS